VSFFDDGEEEPLEPATRVRGSRPAGAGTRSRPQPRRPQRGRQVGADQRTLMMRRGVASAGLVLVLILIALGIKGCVNSEEQESLKTYNRDVSALAAESVESISKPLFSTLASASSKKALEVDEEVNQLSQKAREQTTRLKALSVPGSMEAAQRDLLLVFDLRVEGMEKLATLLQTALGSKTQKSLSEIAGAMELFLASDVIYSQRVVPLIQQTLGSNGLGSLTTSPSRFLPNLGWLETSTVSTRLTGQTQSTGPVTGNHGSALIGVSVAGNTLAAEPTLNHLSGGGNPTFTVTGENSGEFDETNVKVQMTVVQGGKEYKGQSTVEKTEPGKKFTVEVQVHGVPTGVPAEIQAFIEGVPGENDLENNKGTFLGIFE
jgi:hypothetical protein